MIKRLLIIALVISSFSLYYCGQKADEDGFMTNENGLKYKIHESFPDSPKVEIGDIVYLEAIYKTIDDSVFSDSRRNFDHFKIEVMQPEYKGDMNEGLLMLHVWDSASFKINPDSFFMISSRMTVPEFLMGDEYFTIDLKVIDKEKKTVVEKRMQEEAQQQKSAEQQTLQMYIDQHNITQKPEKEGFYYIELKKGKGNIPETGQIAELHFKASLVDDNPVFNTFDAGPPAPYRVGSGSNGVGFEMGLKKMKPGGKAKFIVPSELAFGAKGAGQFVPPYSPVIFEVELYGLYSEHEYQEKLEVELEKRKNEEPKELEKYIKENNIKIKPTNSGLYFIPVKEGNGKKIEHASFVKIHYKAYYLNGKEFENSYDMGKTVDFRVGMDDFIIAGWQEAVMGMKQGEKARLILPSKLAYGMNRKGNIPPYTPLIFDIEIIEVN